MVKKHTSPLPQIRLLEDHVINQIAAGEVIERPVAVVKELVENSLDAGATRVEIEYKNGGKSYIRIEDNGVGMSPDQAMLSLERHATSKLRIADDLLRVRSYGFRGEAIPSIASVSRFTMRTRPAEATAGVELLVNAGKFIHQQDCGMPAGTRIEVAHLFNSVPARRKFLKTDNTESAHIVHCARMYAMAYPQCAFKLIENGRVIFQTTGQGSYQDRIREIWGPSRFKELMEVPLVEAEDYPLSLQAMIGKPGVARSTRQDIICLVNGRPVESRTLTYALIESFHTYIPKGKYPVGYLLLQIDPAVIDVNIHPAKRELRFRDEGTVRHFIISALLKKLRSTHEEQHVPQTQVMPASEEIPAPHITPPSVAKAPPQNVAVPAAPHPAVTPARPVPSPSQAPAKVTPPAKEDAERAEKKINFRWTHLANLQGKYALFENEAGLVLLHLRAAQERIYFDEIVQTFAKEKPAVQPLLLSISLEVEPRLRETVEQSLPFLVKHGFQLEEFGRGFYRLDAVPQWLDPEKAEEFLNDIFYVLREEQITLSDEVFIYERLARLASRFARAEKRSSAERYEIDDLLTKLLRSSNPLACPKGKPTYWQISQNDLNKKFAL